MSANHDAACACPRCLADAHTEEIARLRAELARITACNEAMRGPLRSLREHMGMWAHGEGTVIAASIARCTRAERERGQAPWLTELVTAWRALPARERTAVLEGLCCAADEIEPYYPPDEAERMATRIAAALLRALEGPR